MSCKYKNMTGCFYKQKQGTHTFWACDMKCENVSIESLVAVWFLDKLLKVLIKTPWRTV